MQQMYEAMCIYYKAFIEIDVREIPIKKSRIIALRHSSRACGEKGDIVVRVMFPIFAVAFVTS